MNFQARVKSLRESRGYTQKQVSEHIGITDRNYRRYEAGTTEPTLSVIIALANLYEVTSDYLLGLSDEPGRG